MGSVVEQTSRGGPDERICKGGFGMSIELRPIGFVRTDAEEVPRHWSVSDLEGTLDLDEEYLEGLKDIQPGQRIVVIFNFHRSPEFSSRFFRQTPPHSGTEVGVFSTCSPIRPNPIGMSILEVFEVEGATVVARGLDMLDGTPIVDIKPYIAGKRERAG
jgi:tRNA-Thr(GGU) m(6)t(6)A37 methyltransferase TsaA